MDVPRRFAVGDKRITRARHPQGTNRVRAGQRMIHEWSGGVGAGTLSHLTTRRRIGGLPGGVVGGVGGERPSSVSVVPAHQSHRTELIWLSTTGQRAAARAT